MDKLHKDILIKIAQLSLHQVPNVQIAAVCGVSESRISQIQETEEFKLVLEEQAAEGFEQQRLINQGWDTVEELSLGHILEAMQTKPDPEFALKVAAVANKASRRGALNHTPIGVGAAGVRAVIQLNTSFVEALQQNFEIKDEREQRKQITTDNRRKVNMLGVSAVEKLLKPAKQAIAVGKGDLEEKEIESMLANFPTV